MKVKNESEVAQLCPTLSDPMDCSLPGSSAHGIFQARVLEWGAIAFSVFKTNKLKAFANTENTASHIKLPGVNKKDYIQRICFWGWNRAKQNQFQNIGSNTQNIYEKTSQYSEP